MSAAQRLQAALQAHASHGAMEQEDGLHSTAADAACALCGPATAAAPEPAAAAALPDAPQDLPPDVPPELAHMWELERLHPLEAVLLYAAALLGGIVLSHLAAIGW